jgi:ATP-dependent RNA helicase RhlE
MSFAKLGLSRELLLAIARQGYDNPTAIQQQAIGPILAGKDIIAAAQTGTGKTAGFTLPMLHRLSKNPKSHNKIRALIVTPTRELAAQIFESVKTYGYKLPLRANVVFGGVKINPQIKNLRQGCDILIATPGRLLDLVNQEIVDLSHVEILVLDEADRMLDMGFIHDVKRILKLLPKKRQSLLFSATFSKEIKTLATKFLFDPVIVEVARNNATADQVTQEVYLVDKTEKRRLLSYIIGSKNWQQVLVFTRTKHGANRLTKQLEIDGLKASAIHGNKSQGARTKALEEFKSGKIRILVATDIAARGLDIDKLPHVVNYDLPNVPEDYVHRIGRTGRAQQAGLAVSLVSAEEKKLLRDIEKLIKTKIKPQVMPGFESQDSSEDRPVKKRARPSRHSAKSNESRRRPIKRRD